MLYSKCNTATHSTFDACCECLPVDGVQRQIAMDDTFFVSCGETVLEPREILISLLLPYSSQVWKCHYCLLKAKL